MAEPANDKAEGTGVSRRRPLLARIFKSHDFARDLTVTTLGVLIALGIGEIVDEVRWKFRINATHKAMEQELGLVHGVYVEKRAVQPCLDRRLSEVAEILASARATARLPDIRNISYPPDHGTFGDSWQLALNSGILLHMSPQDVMAIATVWANSKYFAESVHRERDAFDRLSILERRPGPVTPGFLDSVEVQLKEAEIATDISAGIGNRDAALLERNNIKAMWTETEALDPKKLQALNATRNVCRPMLVGGRPYRLHGPVRERRATFVV